jgi:hypothetical protein
MVRDARDVCGSLVRRAGRESNVVMSRSAAGARWARAPTLRGYSHRVFFAA